MRFFYDISFFLFAVFYVPVMAFKGKFHAGFSQKFGRVPPEVTKLEKPVWIHAVSVGEAVLAARLCEAIKNVLPNVPVVVSTTTRTGNEMVKKSSKKVDGIFYYPIDLRGVVKKALDAIDPSVYVIVETELWPNMLEETFNRGIPVVLANGRISDKSFAGYKRLGFIIKKMLRCFSFVCVQTLRDAEKIKTLGCDSSKVRVTGNMKYDTTFSEARGVDVEKVSDVFLSGKRAVVAGSTHCPEETGIIDEFVKLSKNITDVKLIIAPRHIERKDAIRIYVERAGLKCCFFSEVAGEVDQSMSRADVMIVDTIGHLKDLYSLATVVFIGGSLAQRGGQNPIEAAKWGKAVIFGPNMNNFREVARDFIENGAAIRVEDVSRLGEAMVEVLNNEVRRTDMEKGAHEVIEKNSGAVSRTVEVINGCMLHGKS